MRRSARDFAKLLIKGYLRDWFWNVYGKKFDWANVPNTATSFLFVCKGNICRSAFAHYMAEKNSAEKNITIASAGIKVAQSEKSPPDAIQAAKNFGVSLQQHRSVPISLAQCRKADMILVMEALQGAMVRRKFPQYQQRVFLLSQFEDTVGQPYTGWDRYNIADPYAKGTAAFQDCFERIDRCIKGLLKQVT